MKDGPAFQFYASDFLVGTNTWTVDEVGVYIRLLASEWENGGLPKDAKRLSRASGCSQKRFVKCWLTVSQKFHIDGHDLLINDRLESVREEQRKYRELQSGKGKLSAQKRWGDKVTTVITTVEPGLQPDDNREGNREGNRNVTLLPSSSSLSLKKDLKEGENTPFKLPEKEEVEEASDPMIMEQIEKVCIQLYQEKIFPEVHAFKNKMLKQKKNPRSILHTFCRAYLKREFKEGPWAYCRKIIEVEGANYNERDYGKASPKGIG